MKTFPGLIIGSLLATNFTNAQTSHAPVGLNLAGVVDWSTQLVFVDVFKQSRAWIPQHVSGGAWDTGEPLSLTSEGWIASLASGQAAGTLMTRDLAGRYPGGQYVCLYEGEGQIEFGFDAAVASRQVGRIVLNVTPGNGGIYLKITATNAANPLRNIRVLMPGFEGTYQSQPFHPTFLEKIKRFKVLRFMDWGNTNNSPIVKWEQRSTTSYVSQGHARGVALEYIIQLANTLGIDPWFCIPHQAEDDYVRQFATLVKNTLAPNLKAYIEYSNEVWNGQFAQAGYAQARGLALGLSTNAYEAQMRYYSQRAVEVLTICEEVFQSNARLVRVLASQSANSWTGATIMDWKNAFQHADALAIAPYFGGYLGSPQMQTRVQSMSVNQILDSCAVDIVRAMAQVADNKRNAESRGLQLFAYEAGQHLVGHGGVENNQTITDLFHAANRHARMKQLYLDYLRQWDSMGGGVIAMFSSIGLYSKWGSWGLLEWQEQATAAAPKYDAVLEFIASTTAVARPEQHAPTSFTLSQNFPNPVLLNQSATIQYSVANTQVVRMKLYDVLGQELKTILHETHAPGSYRVHLDAAGLQAGVYFYKMEMGNARQVRKLVIVR